MNNVQNAQMAESIVIGSLELWPWSRQVFAGGIQIHLTGLEFNLLSLLMMKSPLLVSKTQIAHYVYQSESSGLEQSICTHISNVRVKLRGYDCQISIQSVRGQGYLLIHAQNVKK